MYLRFASHHVLSLFNPVATPWACGVWVILIASRLRKDKLARWNDFVTAVGYTAFTALGLVLQYILLLLRSHTIDAQLLNVDKMFGFNSALVFSFAYSHHGLFAFLVFGYNLLPLMMCIAWAAEKNLTMRMAVLIGGIGCWIFYYLFPAIGPIYFLTGSTTHAARNCMPSMHLTWALLLALNSRSWLRWPLWIYAGIIAFATIAIGEHYLIDLIAAVPYTVATQYLAKTVLYRSGSSHSAQPKAEPICAGVTE